MSKSNGNRLSNITIRGARLNMLPKLPILDTTELQGNLKDLSQVNYEKLVRTHLKHGIFLPFYVWESPEGVNYIADGHQRRRVLPAEGYTGDVPVVYIEADSLQDAKEKLLVISSQYGRITQEGYDTFAFDLDETWLEQTVNFDALGFAFGDEGGGDETEQGDAEPQTDRAAELQEKWATATGQLWAIGEHRLLVGDSTKRENVERAMGGECAEMVWTDPPYGVSVGDKNKYLNSIAPSNRIEENLENDTLDEPGLTAMLCAAFDNALTHCLAGGAWYVAAPARPLHVLFGQVLKDRGIWRQTIQWVKNNATFSPMGVDYHWQAEPIFYGWKPGAGHRYYGGRQQTTVWEIDRPLKSPEHPTMKPVELVQRGVANSSQNNEIVYDPFAGSGTVLVACQNLSRRGRAIEISEKYTAVILQRMSDAFPGIHIELLESL